LPLYPESDGGCVTLEPGCLAHERAAGCADYSAIPHRDANINDLVTDGTIASPPGFPRIASRVFEARRRFVLFD
jgi:hypothetical protein